MANLPIPKPKKKKKPAKKKLIRSSSENSDLKVLRSVSQMSEETEKVIKEVKVGGF